MTERVVTAADGLRTFRTALRLKHLKDASTVRRPWRKRFNKNDVQRKLDTYQKKMRRAQYRHKKEIWNNALLKARKAVDVLACELKGEVDGKYSNEYYRRAITQDSRRENNRRSVSLWNAFLSMRMASINGSSDSDTDRAPLHTVIKDLKAEWRGMTRAQQIEITKDAVEDLQDKRDNKMLARHNTELGAFHDMSKAIERLITDIDSLHARTGASCTLIITRSATNQFFRPFAHWTSDKARDFWSIGQDNSIEKVILQYEAYMLHGPQGLAHTNALSLNKLKNDLSDLILHKARDAAKTNIPRIYYTSFDQKITVPYGIVYEHWPIPFCAPSSIRTRNELHVVINALQSGAARFRRLTSDEYQDWAMMQTPGDGGIDQTSQSTETTSLCTSIAVDPGIDPSLQSSTMNELPHSSVTHTPFTDRTNDGSSSSKKPRKQRSDKGKKRGPRSMHL